MEEPIQDNTCKKSNPFLPFFFSLVLVAGIVIGYFFSFENTFISEDNQLPGKNNPYRKINNLLDYIEEQYVDSINKKQLVEKTVSSMLKSLDPHSDYIPAEEFKQVNESLQGNFEGIGIEFNIYADTIRVITPIAGGPSDKLGIKAGDKIIKVDGKNVAGVKITNKEVFNKLRGEKGSVVVVTVMRNSVKKTIDFSITRDEIPIYSIDVAYMVKPAIGYIKISRFASTTYDEYLKAFNELSQRGMKKLILDLRGNPGGFLKAAVDIADEFLMNGLQIVYTEGRANPKKTYKATSHGSFENAPLVLLIDEGSASASEIVAGAVQDNDRATIIGRRSFGKGLVQDQLDLPDGSAIRLTVARYYTPTGRCIQKPYDEGNEAYYNEELERYEHGELIKADSSKMDKTKKYFTPGGKTVYGGGGIMPDVFVPMDTAKYTPYVNRAFYAGAVNMFAFDYCDKYRSQLTKEYNAEKYVTSFTISESAINEFVEFAKNKKVEGTDAEINVSISNLKLLLKALIGRNLFDKDAYYPIINETDSSIKAALKILDNNH